jgi:hypothetical protein
MMWIAYILAGWLGNRFMIAIGDLPKPIAPVAGQSLCEAFMRAGNLST